MPSAESPCRKICTLDPASQLCLGCGRTLADIERWGGLTASERTGLMKEAAARLTTLLSARARATGAA
jgi:predicted Fe-S protein YdhL (DUF1289 family)